MRTIICCKYGQVLPKCSFSPPAIGTNFRETKGRSWLTQLNLSQTNNNLNVSSMYGWAGRAQCGYGANMGNCCTSRIIRNPELNVNVLTLPPVLHFSMSPLTVGEYRPSSEANEDVLFMFEAFRSDFRIISCIKGVEI
jgi:hypothetical protein